MAITQIRASQQIKNGSLTVDKISPNFLDGGIVWSLSTDNSGRLAGLAKPINPNDAATKQYIDDLFAGGVMKAPDSFTTDSDGNYPSDYKDSGEVKEGDTFIVADISNGNKVGGNLVEIGDLLIAKTDNPGNDDNNWILIQRNVDQATEDTKGLAKIATQDTVDAGTDDTTIVTPLKLKTTLENKGIVKVTAGAGLKETDSDDEKTIEVVSDNAGITVNDNSISLTIGNSNGTSLEITSTGVELASTVTGARTFDADVNEIKLAKNPDGNEDLAVATVKYVNDKVNSIPVDVFGEVPSFDAGDTEVTLNHTPVSGTVRVYLNGLRLLEGDNNDYTVDGSKITFTSALQYEDILQVDYKY